MDDDISIPGFIVGKEYEWRWPTDEEEADHPDCYAVFQSEISDKHLMGYEDVLEYFGR
ncbi:MAG: hypothetical protein ACYC69_05440 [Thermodesulfovibrionales bacterium]